MTDHAHRWQLGVPVGRTVTGRCSCGATQEFAAFRPANAHLRSRARPATRAQRAESEALMSHAQSLVADPR